MSGRGAHAERRLAGASEPARGESAPRAVGHLAAAARRVAEAACAAAWWSGEFLGDHAYARYLERHAREHPGHAPLSARDFWRARERDAEGQASGGCC